MAVVDIIMPVAVEQVVIELILGYLYHPDLLLQLLWAVAALGQLVVVSKVQPEMIQYLVP